MLNKLLKHEFIATGRMFLPIFALILILTPLLGFIIRIMGMDDNSFLSIFGILSMIGYILVLLATFIASIIFIIIRFYKSMTTDEAYLTFTIPAKTSSVIISKLIPAVLWQFLFTIFFFVSIGLFTLILDVWNFSYVSYGMERLFAEFPFLADQSFSLSLCIVLLFITLIISTITGTLQIYVSIAIGQIMNSHRLIASIGFYFAIYTVLQIITSIFAYPITYSYTNTLDIQLDNAVASAINNYNLYLVIAILLQIVIGISFFFTTHFFFKKKLNLE